ncbi:MAG: hypothetical protein IJ837_03900 [Clostridia bacterium]|nr:hypothetical protein [Clostridia bacterium]
MNTNKISEILEKSPLVHPAGVVMVGLKQHQNNKKMKKIHQIVEEAENQRNSEIDEALKTFKGLKITKEQLEKTINRLERLEAKDQKTYNNYIQNLQKFLDSPNKQNLNEFSKLSTNLGMEMPKTLKTPTTPNAFIAMSLAGIPTPPKANAKTPTTATDYQTAAKKGTNKKLLAAAIVCAIGAGAFGAYTTLGDKFGLPNINLPDLGGGKGPSFSNYTTASVPPTNEVDTQKCYVEGVDENSEAFKNLIASKDYQTQALEITTKAQQQIDELSAQLNAEVATKIQSVDAIEEASGYTAYANVKSWMGFDKLPNESTGAFHIRRLNAVENELMANTQKIEDYFNEHVEDYTKNLYEKYGIDLTFKHFKSVQDFIDNDMYLELRKITNPEEGKFYHMISGKPYEYVVISYDEEKMPEKVDLDFIQEYLIHDGEHLTLYNDITVRDLSGDYMKSSYYEKNPVYSEQYIFDSYCDDLGEPYASQIKEIKNDIDVLQEDYLKQVEQINSDATKEILNLQSNTLGLDNDLIALGVQAADSVKTDKLSLIQSFVDSALNASESVKEVAQNLTDDLIHSL